MDQQNITLPPPAPSAASVYGGFWRRLGACIIDAIVIIIPFALLTMLLPSGESGITFLSGAACAAYSIIMHGRYGATLGKMALGIKVTQLDGSPIDYRIAAWRYSPLLAIGFLGLFLPLQQVAGILNLLYVLLGAVILAVHAQKRTIHDFIAKTVVLRKKPDDFVVVSAS